MDEGSFVTLRRFWNSGSTNESKGQIRQRKRSKKTIMPMNRERKWKRSKGKDKKERERLDVLDRYKHTEELRSTHYTPLRPRIRLSSDLASPHPLPSTPCYHPSQPLLPSDMPLQTPTHEDLDWLHLPLNHPAITSRYEVQRYTDDQLVLYDISLPLLFWYEIEFLHAQIRSASHGRLLASLEGEIPFEVREGAYRDLGLAEPAVFGLMRRTNGINPLSDGVATFAQFMDELAALQECARSTQEWVRVARAQTLRAGEGSGWVWDDEDMLSIYWADEEGATRGNASTDNATNPHDAQFPSALDIPVDPQQAVILHPVLSASAENDLVRYSVNVITTPSNECRDLVLHPVWSSNAANALISVQGSAGQVQNPNANLCRVLIPHPIYGPGAVNALVPYIPYNPVRLATSDVNDVVMLDSSFGPDDDSDGGAGAVQMDVTDDYATYEQRDVEEVERMLTDPEGASFDHESFYGRADMDEEMTDSFLDEEEARRYRVKQGLAGLFQTFARRH
ncbi:hypothetical protein OH76DRAFT_103172 [Lentinus brumalis]|uniref:Uncharacterized protein n=1 Tax=Lentinus brumalis TaxID=2498619 RepID=A0A371CQ11_9APHY|nr:hypothetical protein OH76DRAFT_103172 [Polyporus brumalis]